MFVQAEISKKFHRLQNGAVIRLIIAWQNSICSFKVLGGCLPILAAFSEGCQCLFYERFYTLEKLAPEHSA
jgi:hypothetical protein